MQTVKLTADGHVQLQEDYIRYLNLSVGDEMEITKLADGSIRLSKPISQPKKTLADFAGCLKDKTEVRLTIDELQNAIANSATNASMQGLI